MRYRLDDGFGAWQDDAAKPGTAGGWVPCPVQEAPAPTGAAAWSVRLYERHVQGPAIEQAYGVTGGILTASQALTIGAATAGDVCQGLCGHEIAKGQICGAYMTARYCLCCITTDEPQSTFRNGSGRVIPPLADRPDETKETASA